MLALLAAENDLTATRGTLLAQLDDAREKYIGPAKETTLERGARI
jgi:hypothetical protein